MKSELGAVATGSDPQLRYLSEKMKASVLTAKWDRERKVAPTEGLNFTFSEKGEIRLAKRIANSLLYTRSGVFPSKAVDDPLFVIGQALSKLDVADKEQFAKSRLSQTATVSNIEIGQVSQVTVDNLSGYELFAKASDTESGNSMVVYQMILYEDQSYYIMQGLVSTKLAQTTFPFSRRWRGRLDERSSCPPLRRERFDLTEDRCRLTQLLRPSDESGTSDSPLTSFFAQESGAAKASDQKSWCI